MSTPAKGVKGCLLYSPFTKNHFFRVYNPDNSFQDYELCAEDFDIEIRDNFVVLRDGSEDEMGKIDWSDQVLGKKTPQGVWLNGKYTSNEAIEDVKNWAGVEPDIKVIKGWEGVLLRPSMYLGKKSLYGLQCLIVGLNMGKSDVFDEDWMEFDSWVRSNVAQKMKVTGRKAFELALEKAEGDDEKAFDVWSEWFLEWKAKDDAL